MTLRRRADQLLVERGLFESRAKAQAAIEAGLVTADQLQVHKSSDQISVDAMLQAQPAHPWVSRGGVKLEAALDHFQFDPRGRICLDVGASTGGFSHVLLARGAKRIYAVDVGRGQFHPSLRGREDIEVIEETDIRALNPARMTQIPDFVVIDVSFIALELALPAASRLAASRADLIALIKPQFEAGRRQLKKGVVRDPQVHTDICNRVSDFVVALGWTVTGLKPSPLLGGDGNQEFLLGASRG